MHPDVGKLLWDAQQAAERVARFTAEKTLADYEADLTEDGKKLLSENGIPISFPAAIHKVGE